MSTKRGVSLSVSVSNAHDDSRSSNDMYVYADVWCSIKPLSARLRRMRARLRSVRPSSAPPSSDMRDASKPFNAYHSRNISRTLRSLKHCNPSIPRKRYLSLLLLSYAHPRIIDTHDITRISLFSASLRDIGARLCVGRAYRSLGARSLQVCKGTSGGIDQDRSGLINHTTE